MLYTIKVNLVSHIFKKSYLVKNYMFPLVGLLTII